MSRNYFIAAAVLLGGVVGWPSQAHAQVAPAVFRVPVTGVVEMGLAPFIERAIREAESAGASFVVLDIDTPGGRVDSAERIADAISDSGVPVYAFVNRRAFSAGALIALATRGIYMRPGSVIGAATPVDGSGTKASEKIVSAMRSEMRALAEAQGLDPAVAEAMVDESLAIPDVVEAGQLLTLTTEEAVGIGYASETADFATLLEDLGVAGAVVSDVGVNWFTPRGVALPVVARILRPHHRGQNPDFRARRAGRHALLVSVLRVTFDYRARRLGRPASCWSGGLVRHRRGTSDPGFRAVRHLGHRRYRRRHLHEPARQSSRGAGLQPGGRRAQHDRIGPAHYRMGSSPASTQEQQIVSIGDIPSRSDRSGHRLRVHRNEGRSRRCRGRRGHGPSAFGHGYFP